MVPSLRNLHSPVECRRPTPTSTSAGRTSGRLELLSKGALWHDAYTQQVTAFHEKTTSCQQKNTLQCWTSPVPGTANGYAILSRLEIQSRL